MLSRMVFLIWVSRLRVLFWWLDVTGRKEIRKALTTWGCRNWGLQVFLDLDCRVEVTGEELVPMRGPLVVMSNHQGIFDIPLIMHGLNRPVGFLAKHSVFRIPVIAFWMRILGCRPVHRKDTRRTLKEMEHWGREMTAKEECLVIFPEGTRSRHPDGKMNPLRRGSLRLAEENHFTVLPVAIDGTRLLTNKTQLAQTAKGGRVVRMKILPPLQVQPMNAPQAKAFMENLAQQIDQARQAIQVTWPALPTETTP